MSKPLNRTLLDLPCLPRRHVLALAAMTGLHPQRALAQAATKTLVVARTGQFKSLDPVRGFEENSTNQIQLYYAGRFDAALGAARSFARSMWPGGPAASAATSTSPPTR